MRLYQLRNWIIKELDIKKDFKQYVSATFSPLWLKLANTR